MCIRDSLYLVALHILVVGFRLYVVGALHIAGLARDTQAALAALLLACGLQNPWVDHGIGMSVGVDDHDALQDSHLGSRQTHALSLIHI